MERLTLPWMIFHSSLKRTVVLQKECAFYRGIVCTVVVPLFQMGKYKMHQLSGVLFASLKNGNTERQILCNLLCRFN